MPREIMTVHQAEAPRPADATPGLTDLTQAVLLALDSTREVASATNGNAAPPRPHWNADRRELTYRGRLVKRYRRPAANQERILAAFEEEGWPAAIDDPLPGEPNADPRERLHEAVRRLNGRQQQAQILFERDGTGGRILWRVPEAG
jgi:hypothetical protein